VLGIVEEDLGKIEGVSGAEELLPIIPGMYGLVAGKIDADTTPAEAAARELFEERRLVKPSTVFTNSLPTVNILQKREEGQLSFTVHGHEFGITPEDISFINLESPTWEIPDERLGEFLLKEKGILRPSVHAILYLFLSQLEEKGSYVTT
jgi:8-oxo-dGTP pyrophosphatase MutT (NUDIX family)